MQGLIKPGTKNMLFVDDISLIGKNREGVQRKL